MEAAANYIPDVKLKHSEDEAGRYIQSRTVTTANWEAITWHLLETKAVHYAKADGFRELWFHIPTLNRLVEVSISYVQTIIRRTATALGRQNLQKASDWAIYTTALEDDHAMVLDAIMTIVNCIKSLREFNEKYVFRHSCPLACVVSGSIPFTLTISYGIPAQRIWRILEIREARQSPMLTVEEESRLYAPSEYGCNVQSWLSFLQSIRL